MIESVLGSGGFGDVYQVSPTKRPDRKYAMKTEYFDSEKRKLLNRLKVEMAVFGEIQKCSSPIDKSHFVNYIDKGKTEMFKFIIMEMVSYSLIDIRTTMMDGFTSNSTIIQIARQTLQSIEALHFIGYVHRDIKPHNFAIGRVPNDSKIYMLDFGIARKYCDSERRVRIPRKSVRFLGTVKYAARACHNEKEQCRRDDIEVWCYMILEYYNPTNLIWRKETNKVKIVNMKQKLMTKHNTSDMKLLIPKAFHRAIESIEQLTYTCAPDFPFLHKILDTICKDENIDETLPPDWVGRTMPMDKKKKKTTADEKLLNDDDSNDRAQWDARERKKREGAKKMKKLEEDLAKIYKELDEQKSPAEIRAEIRNKLRKAKEEERRKRAERKEEDDEDDGSDSEDESDSIDDPRRRSKMGSVMKTVKDEPSRQQKYENRKKRTGKRTSREDLDDENDRPSGNRKKGSRQRSSYGNGGSRMDNMESMKKKKQTRSRMDKPAESPPLKSVSNKIQKVNDYIVFKSANDMEKEADAKDKEAAERKAKGPDKEKNSSQINDFK
ncbi:hypothetical protein PRIPAC_81526 [Pristionchus pacificus]|nr:hypothetical protein PRIPAC_81526 [Pristionchus pacificus]